jgi:hypothetical protein
MIYVETLSKEGHRVHDAAWRLRCEGAASVPDRDLAWFEEGEALSRDCRNVPGSPWNEDRREQRALPFLFM